MSLLKNVRTPPETRTHSPLPRFSGDLGLTSPRSRLWIFVPFLASILVHGIFTLGISLHESPTQDKASVPVKMQIRTVEKKREVELVKKEVPKEKPRPEPKKEKPKLASERKVPQPVTEPVKPIQGLDPRSMSKDGQGIAVPVGNTLMVEDEGKRVKPEDVKALSSEDLSRDARLIAKSVVIPSYSEEAIDANLEGMAVVDVYVDETGKVKNAELKRKVGYGMDERIVAAALNARFEPGTDKYGRPIAIWAEIKFRLELP